jgi:hypothetical protein
MEKKLIKSTIYGFILGLSLMILFVSDIDTITRNGGSTRITYLSGTDYALKLIRYSIVFTYFTVGAVFIYEKYLRGKSW